MGHATRCIPIIYELLRLNIDVIIAASGNAQNLLQKEFPQLLFIHVKGYKITYSKTKFWLPIKLASQLPKILLSIYNENKWLKKIIALHKIDAVISDNRLGLYHANLPCVYITHQLAIKTGNMFTEKIAQKMHYFFINKYNTCWVPDNANEENFAGELSHPKKLPQTPIQYIGIISRFKKIITTSKFDLLILLSGPEPQRTIFENTILKQLKTFNGTIAFVCGLPTSSSNAKININTNNSVQIISHLLAKDLNILIAQSKMVICRSGYTTVMDLIKLQKNAIVVPTPGQTEQEYLANYLTDKKYFFSIAQNKFLLKDAVKNAATFSFKITDAKQNNFIQIVENFVHQVQQN